ncbi:hypothetical protein GOODEAATRI_030311 [Goodea atripinnis]|uniref:Uncharacterized protein n=1 Tax=Goodea atripinnis TaxID=208336 RepID=A0ABV0MXV8_9TELE
MKCCVTVLESFFFSIRLQCRRNRGTPYSCHYVSIGYSYPELATILAFNHNLLTPFPRKIPTRNFTQTFTRTSSKTSSHLLIQTVAAILNQETHINLWELSVGPTHPPSQP